jgi:hypothetical protein
MQYEIDQSKENRDEQRKESCVREFKHLGQEAVPERTDDQQDTLHINLLLTRAPPFAIGVPRLNATILAA